MVGADLEFGLYELRFYTRLHPDDAQALRDYEIALSKRLRKSTFPDPGQPPQLNRNPGAQAVDVPWEYKFGLPTFKIQILAAPYGQDAAEARNREHAFRVGMRTRFRTAARRGTFQYTDVMSQKFIDDHVSATAMDQRHKVSHRVGQTAQYNHVILIDPAGANRNLWESIIDFVGSLNIALAIRTGVDYPLPGYYNVDEYDMNSRTTTAHAQTKVWVQFQPHDNIMKIHHLSGVKYRANGHNVYHGQPLIEAPGILPPIRNVRYLDLTHRDDDIT